MFHPLYSVTKVNKLLSKFNWILVFSRQRPELDLSYCSNRSPIISYQLRGTKTAPWSVWSLLGVDMDIGRHWTDGLVQRSAIRSTIEDETDVDHVMQLFKLSSARNAHKIMQISDIRWFGMTMTMTTMTMMTTMTQLCYSNCTNDNIYYVRERHWSGFSRTGSNLFNSTQFSLICLTMFMNRFF